MQQNASGDFDLSPLQRISSQQVHPGRHPIASDC